MTTKLTKDQEKILQVLRSLGGTATAREIAARTKRTVNGVANALNAIAKKESYKDRLYRTSKLHGDSQWHLD